MKSTILALIAAMAVMAQSKAPIAANPVVDVQGQITKVSLTPGHGTPFIEVKTSGETVKVWLGSMRYLMERNFSPKAGQDVAVKGYRPVGSQEITASTITLTESKQTLELRDAAGYPLWRGGRSGHGGHGCCRGGGSC